MASNNPPEVSDYYDSKKLNLVAWWILYLLSPTALIDQGQKCGCFGAD